MAAAAKGSGSGKRAGSARKSRSQKKSPAIETTTGRQRQESAAQVAADETTDKIRGPGSIQVTRRVKPPVCDLLQRAKDDSAAAALRDLAQDALEDNTNWESGLTKYAQWRYDFRDRPTAAFQNGVCEGVKGKWLDDGQDDRKLLKPTGRIWQ